MNAFGAHISLKIPLSQNLGWGLTGFDPNFFKTTLDPDGEYKMRCYGIPFCKAIALFSNQDTWPTNQIITFRTKFGDYLIPLPLKRLKKMDTQIEGLRDYLTDMTVPDKRSSIDINPDHITMLQGTKSKKQLSRKKRTTKASTLNRREYAQLGLNTLPTRQMKYTEALPLHRLWKGYMKAHLGLQVGDNVPQVYEPRYDAFSKLLIKTDLHGAKISVIKSKCSTLVGISGIVVLDSKNVLKILGRDDRLRTIPKSECIFSMKFGNMNFTLFGKHLCIRAAERSVKKIKNYIEPFDF